MPMSKHRRSDGNKESPCGKLHRRGWFRQKSSMNGDRWRLLEEQAINITSEYFPTNTNKFQREKMVILRWGDLQTPTQPGAQGLYSSGRTVWHGASSNAMCQEEQRTTKDTWPESGSEATPVRPRRRIRLPSVRPVTAARSSGRE